MTQPLLLDEHYPPAHAQTLRDAGFDVIAVAENPALTGVPDTEIFQWAINQGRRIVTENIRDFRPFLTLALSTKTPFAPMLFTTAKKYPRRISQLATLTTALCKWLEYPDISRQPEEWL